MFTSETRINDINENSIVNKEILSRKDDLLEDSKFEIGIGEVKFSYASLVRFFRKKIGKKDTYIDIFFLSKDSIVSANVSLEKYSSPINLLKRIDVRMRDTISAIDIFTELCTKASVFICEKYDPIVSVLYDYNYTLDYENSTAWNNNFYKSFSEREELLKGNLNSKSNYLSVWSLVILGNMYEEKAYTIKNKNLLLKSLNFYQQAVKKENKLNEFINNNVSKINKFTKEFTYKDDESDLIARVINKYEDQINQSKQLIIAYNENIEQNDGFLMAFEKGNSSWEVFMSKIEINIGTKGFAKINLKVEGDLKAPTGVFTITSTFGYIKDINTKMPFIVLNKSHVWITDPRDINYNKIITQYPKTTRFEQMLRADNLHKYGVIIDYNTHPVIANKGSAITIHVQRRRGFGTAGCISIPEKKLIKIIEWLDPLKKPLIIMGNINEL